ncbi:DUF1007 family protein [uncultured Litoreibacter sp.]|uniref:DUF1007 family protein n=1 Tax=uncultured Litoreibacter sp. TaxID=1392394 RepID=UPI002603BD7C|nr:DUF1007 family protein [uncultured Litoreibacter sp.]
MRRLLLCSALILPAVAQAHPHIFIETGLEAIVDEQGRLTHVKVTWTYDDFYSLLITEDMKLDQDFDGVLTAEEEARLTGFDMNWDEGYYGDLVALLGDRNLTLLRPQDYTASFADGRVTSTHIRAVAEAPVITGGELVLRPFDETFYTAYDVTLPVSVTGAQACLISKIEPNIDAELEALQALLADIDANSNPEDAGLGNMGERFATDVRILCAGS